MARRHGPLFQPHYPRRNQYGPVWEGAGEPAPGKAICPALEPAVGIGELVGLRVSLAVGVHGDGGDLLLLDGAVGHAGLGGGDGIHHVHAGRDLAEGGILAVQVLGIGVHDEELAAGGVGGLGAGHAQHAPLVLQLILEAIEQELALDAVAGAAHAGALGAAALDHKAGDDPVENQAVIEIVIAQVDEIVNALGCLLRVQLALDDTAVFHGDGKSRICHYRILSFMARSIWRFMSRSAAACRLS